MKKKKILITALFLLLFLSGCGKADDNQIQVPASEKIAGEQPVDTGSEEAQQKIQPPESQQSEEQQSGSQQSKLQPSEGQQTNPQQSKPQLSEGQQAGPQQAADAETEFSFEKLSGWAFYFSSGVGAWWTELSINSDGTFHGIYRDSDMGDIGDGYPHGTLYYCDFTGIFDGLKKVDEFTYKMKLASIEFAQEPNKKEIIDNVRYIYSTAYGLDDGEDFYLYLPGAKLTDLPEPYLNWIGYYNPESIAETTLPFYGLYNANTGDGFSSYEYEKKSLSENITMEISFAEEHAAELEAKLQAAASQLDMNTASAELFQAWDDTLNIVWKLLAAELDDATMEALRTEERNWIAFKDAEVEAAGLEYEGGSMQPFAESMKAAELTKERVYELAKHTETW